MWRGDATLPTEDQGVTILGTPLGHPDFVEASLWAKSREHDTLFDRLVAVPDLQCAWFVALVLRFDQSQLHVAGGTP